MVRVAVSEVAAAGPVTRFWLALQKYPVLWSSRVVVRISSWLESSLGELIRSLGSGITRCSMSVTLYHSMMKEGEPEKAHVKLAASPTTTVRLAGFVATKTGTNVSKNGERGREREREREKERERGGERVTVVHSQIEALHTCTCTYIYM